MSEPFYSTVIPGHGPDGNIFVITANACRLLRMLGRAADAAILKEKVTAAPSYDTAIAEVEVYFRVDRD